jgi:hypothetical protein
VVASADPDSGAPGSEGPTLLSSRQETPVNTAPAKQRARRVHGAILPSRSGNGPSHIDCCRLRPLIKQTSSVFSRLPVVWGPCDHGSAPKASLSDCQIAVSLDTG